MIVIFGATGNIGGAAALELRARGLPVRAVMRDVARAGTLVATGCEVAMADLYDEHAVVDALRGADAVLVICPLKPAAEDVEADAGRIIDNLGRAIEAARPRAVVAISDYGAHRPRGTGITMIFHRLEQRLAAAPAAMTFLRSAEHMQNWSRHLRAARQHGVLPSLHHPVSRLFPTVSAPDVGVVAAEILAEPGQHRGGPRIVHVEGPRRYAASDVAAAVEHLLGLPVEARALAREAWLPALLAGGLGGSYARLVTELQDAHNAGGIDVEPGGEVRRGATELGEALSLARRPVVPMPPPGAP